MKQFEIYFSDLTVAARVALLAFYNMESEDDGNWENSPIAIVDYEPESE